MMMTWVPTMIWILEMMRKSTVRSLRSSNFTLDCSHELVISTVDEGDIRDRTTDYLDELARTEVNSSFIALPPVSG